MMMGGLARLVMMFGARLVRRCAVHGKPDGRRAEKRQRTDEEQKAPGEIARGAQN
jgi:hypothetical protein